jgi:hypothetical protein
MVRIWEVTFGDNADSINVVAKTVDEAIVKARKIKATDIKNEPKFYWISGVELLAEGS